MPNPLPDHFERDVLAARRYFTAHVTPANGWQPGNLMYGAKAPMLGAHGEGNDDRDYCKRVLRAALDEERAR